VRDAAAREAIAAGRAGTENTYRYDYQISK
jgi:hypothetical protein